MAREEEKRDFHSVCSAGDLQKLKRMENNTTVRELRDKIEELNFRLTECRNENQMLKRNLHLAKKMVYQEVGRHDLDFQTLLKRGTTSGWKGRMEGVLLLKRKLQELKDYLRELEGEAPEPRESPSKVCATHRIPRDRKLFWRMELERRLARETAEKDMTPLIDECGELRKVLDREKTRHRELNDEVKLLRAEMQSQVEKNQEDVGIMQSFRTLEAQLQEALAQRAEIRNDLEGSRTRNKRLAEEIETLKQELSKLQDKATDNNKLIDSLTTKHKGIQEAIDAEKRVVQQHADRYREELKKLQQNHEADVEILDRLQGVVYERNDLVEDLRKDVEDSLMVYIQDKENVDTALTQESEDIPASELKSKESDKEKDKQPETEIADDSQKEEMDAGGEKERKMLQLKMDCAKYESLFEAAQKESQRLLYIASLQDAKMNEIAVQVVESGKLIMQKNAEKKELLDKVVKLQRSIAVKKKKGKALVPTKNQLEDLKIRTHAQEQENEFLRAFLMTAVCEKARDFNVYKDFVAETKQHFLKSLRNIKDLQNQKEPLTATMNEAPDQADS